MGDEEYYEERKSEDLGGLSHIFGTNEDGARIIINSIKIPKVYTQNITCNSDEFVGGNLQVNGTTTIGGQLTTSGGTNLVLNPSQNGVIDFAGHTVINFPQLSSAVSSPNRYQILSSATVTTTDATSTAVLTAATVSGTGYLFSTDIVCTTNTGTPSSGVVKISSYAKNVSGTLHVEGQLEETVAVDSVLTGIQASHTVTSGSTLQINVTGLANTTIKWFAVATVTCQSF